MSQASRILMVATVVVCGLAIVSPKFRSACYSLACRLLQG